MQKLDWSVAGALGPIQVRDFVWRRLLVELGKPR